MEIFDRVADTELVVSTFVRGLASSKHCVSPRTNKQILATTGILRLFPYTGYLPFAKVDVSANDSSDSARARSRAVARALVWAKETFNLAGGANGV